MTTSLPNLVRLCTGWLSLLLLLCAQAQQHSSNGTTLPATAYLVESMRQAHEPSNHSFNNLLAILRSDPAYDSIIITEDYSIDNPQEYPNDPIHLHKNLLITSPPGEMNILSFAFLVNMVQLNNYTVTLDNIIFHRARKTSGHSVPFFSGYGLLVVQEAVRMRTACQPGIKASFEAAKNAPRAAGFPGKQIVKVVNTTIRGLLYPDSLQAIDMIVSVGPGDVEDGVDYTSYVVVYRNATRVCQRYVSSTCNNQCLEKTIDGIVSQEIQRATSRLKQQQLLSTVVPAVVVPTVLLVAVGVLAVVLLRHKRLRGHAARLFKPDPQSGVPTPSAASGSFGDSNDVAGSKDRHGGGGSFISVSQIYQGPGSTSKLADAFAFERLARRAAAGHSEQDWQLIACHTSPELSEATAHDAISLGVLLGAGSFGRVYRGRWQNRDVAVKVMHHDAHTAASVANEVDLVMSFRHPNITAAYQCRTWSCVHAKGHDTTSQPATGQASVMSQVQDFRAGDGFPDHEFAPHSVSAAAVSDTRLKAAASGSGLPTSATPDVHQQDEFLPVFHSRSASPSGSTLASFSSFAVTGQPNAVCTTTASLHSLPTTAGVQGSSRSPSIPESSAASQSLGNDQGRSNVQQAAQLINENGAPPFVQVANLQHAWPTATLTSDMAAAAAAAQFQDAAALGHEELATRPTTSTALLQVQSSACDSTAFVSATNGDTSTQVITATGSDPTAMEWKPSSHPSPCQANFLTPVQPSEHATNPHASQHALPLLQPPPPHQQLPASTAALSIQPNGPQLNQQYGIDVTWPAVPSSSQLTQSQVSSRSLQKQQQQQAVAPTASRRSSKSACADNPGADVEAETWIVLEHCDGGTMFDLMREGRLRIPGSQQVDMVQLLVYLSGVAAGMQYLHKRNCVHGDLKPANLLLQKQPCSPFNHVVKVSDFGLSRSLTTGQSHRSTRMLGTFNRAAPELLRLGRLSPACDVYAFGILMWELYTGAVAFSASHYGQVFEWVVLLQERPAIPPDMPERYIALMTACWAQDPVARPTFDVIQATLSDMLRDTPNSSDRFISDL